MNMTTMNFSPRLMLLLLVLATVIGCEEEKENPVKKRLAQQAAAKNAKPAEAGDPSLSYAPLPPPAVEAGKPIPVEGSAPVAATVPNNQAANNEVANTVQGVQIHLAGDINPEWSKPLQQGFGKQGRDYGPGYITETMTAYWRLRERASFEIPFQHTMKNYVASNNGKPPKDVATLKKEILDEAALQLPDLAPGQLYVYDPHSGELLVMQKKPN